MQKIIYLLFITIFFSCDTNNPKAIVFKNIYTIQGDLILDNSYNIRRLDFVKEDFLLASLNSDQYWFSLFDAKTLKMIIKFGKKGNGPNEFMGPLVYCQNEIINDILYIWFYDANSFKYYKFNASSFSVEEKIDLNIKLNFDKIFIIDSTKLVGNTTNLSVKMNRLQIYNPKTDSITKIVPVFPKVKNDNQDLGFIFYRYNYLFNNYLDINPDKTKIVSAMSSFNRIDIFNMGGKVEKTIIGEETKSKDFISKYLNAKDIKKTKLTIYYNGVYASNKYIYSLYYNQLFSNYGEKLIPTKIRIFSWESQPLVEITVPNYLLNFTIDEKNGFIYGVDYYNEKILRYNIKHILDEL